MIAAIQHAWLRRQVRADGHVKINRAEQFKIGRQHTDHSQHLAIYPERTADDGGIAAELFFPHAVADQRRWRRRRLVILFDKRPAKLRLYAEQLKEIPVHGPALQPDRPVHASQIESLRSKTCHRLERLRSLAPVLVIRIRSAHPLTVAIFLRQNDQPIGVGEAQ